MDASKRRTPGLMQSRQSCAKQQRLPLEPPRPKPKPKLPCRRLVYLPAAAALLHCACAFLKVAAGQQVAYESSWSTANLDVARYSLAATCLPNLAIFSGGFDGTSTSKAVDIFNATSGKWSTASLSSPGEGITATSLPIFGLAIFAGGFLTGGGYTLSAAVDIFHATTSLWSTAILSVGRGYLAATSLPDLGIAIFAGGGDTTSIVFDAVDIFNATSGGWTTAALSIPRRNLAATSLPNHKIAMFAGGRSFGDSGVSYITVDILNVTAGKWSTASLSAARGDLAATSLPNLGVAIFAGGGDFHNPVSNTVDIYNATANQWSTAILSEARGTLAATSLTNVGIAIFAGGFNGNGYSNVVDIYNVITGTWSTAALSAARSLLAATSLQHLGVAIFAGGGSWSGQYFKTVDIFSVNSVPETTSIAPATTSAPAATTSAAPATTSAPLSNTSVASSTHMFSSSAPNSTFAPLPTTSLPSDSFPPISPSPFPAVIAAAAAATSGHLPRLLELVQFLSIYCTSLSSRQQTRVSEFQVASFTHIATSKAEYCGVCPGFCSQPLVLLLPTFALMSCLVALCVLVVVADAYRSRSGSGFASPVEDRLLEVRSASSADATHGCSSLRLAATAFLARYSRSLIETCSAYVVMPCTFVFVLNAWPSAFARAGSFDRAMIVMLPFMALLFRALVIRQRVVQLTSADQKLLYASSAFSCFIAAALSVPFASAARERQSAQPFESNTLPQCIVLALLVLQLVAQTVIRRRATEKSSFDNTDWPWSTAASHASSAVFSFDELATRLVLGSIKRSSAAIAGAKFFLLNYVVISQMAMVIAGLASARANSAASVEASSVVVGRIPLITSGALLLHNAIKLVKLLWQKCCGRQKQADRRRSSRDSSY
jgi:hypothetical protein